MTLTEQVKQESTMKRGARARALLALLCNVPLAFTLAACPSKPPATPSALVVRGEADAERFMTQFFSAYIDTRIDECVEMLCEKDRESVTRAHAFMMHAQAPESPYRIQRFQVRSVEPLWIGSEPYYRVEVSFPRRRSVGELLHQYSVRVRDGCIEGFLTGPRASTPLMPKPREEDDSLLDDGMNRSPPLPDVYEGEPLEAERERGEIIEL